MADAPSGRTRLFFALWPDQRVRESLSALARVAKTDCGGRIMQPRNLHLTLAFLGDTVEAQRDAAVAAASRVKMSPMVRCTGSTRVPWVPRPDTARRRPGPRARCDAPA